MNGAKCAFPLISRWFSSHVVTETLPGPQAGLCPGQEPGLGSGSEETPCSCGFTVASRPDFRSLNRDVLNSFLLYPKIFGFSPEFGVQALFLVLGEARSSLKSKGKSIPLDKSYGIATDMVHGMTPLLLTLRGTLRKIIFPLGLRFSMSEISSKLTMLCYSSRSSNTLPSWNLLAIETSPPLLLLGLLFTRTLAVRWGVPDDWIWNVYSLESSEVGTWGKKKCHHAVLETFSSIRGKRSVILRRKNEKTYHMPRGSFVAVVYINAHVNHRILSAPLLVLEWCSKGDKSRWCSRVDQIF